MKLPIYMDHHSTTPTDPRVLEKMLPFFTQIFGNAASRQHSFGWTAEAAVEAARSQVAKAIGAHPEEIIFTSGATESNNLALLGIAEAAPSKGHLITSAIEHKAVLDPLRRLEAMGWTLTILPVDREGRLDPGEIEKSLRPDTLLVSVMAANNEIGTIQALREIGATLRPRGVVFHSDAAQAIGRMPIDVEAMKLDLVSLSAHKCYGPKGVGALYVKKTKPRLKIEPRFYGGGHEAGLRSGTLNVPGIVGMGEAFALAIAAQEEENTRLSALSQRMLRGLQEKIPEIILNGAKQNRLAQNLNLTFPGISADRLMMDMKEVAVSSASACTTATPKPSHVLEAIGLSPEAAKSTLRFGLGRFTTQEEVEYVVSRVVEWVQQQKREALQGGPK